MNNQRQKEKKKKMGVCRGVRGSLPLYLLMLPSIVIFLLFTYYPMYGIIIAFKDFTPALGIMGSPWAGFKYFDQFFRSYQFWPTIRNTLVISFYTILVTFPLPIVLALMCNQMKAARFKKFFQVSTYLPHFISTVVMCGMIILFLSPSTGIIAKIVGLFGIKLPNLMGSASAFPSIYVWTEAWQHVGWDSILYIATLSSVDPTLYEAARMDGANKWQRVVHVDLPALLPTATVMFILRMGSVMSVGFEKVYLLQNTLNSSTSEILSTYVYKMGLISNQYSLSAAIGLFNNLINLILLVLVNQIAKKLSDTSLV
ncbi:MAG: ABC transporter permease subunit [Eubacteriales bacterium]|nr:ABC transporter permease subunit [Eubacteriales bacterium]